MNTRLFILALILLSSNVFGTIKNGYENEVQAHYDSLEILRSRLSEYQSLSHGSTGKLKRAIKEVVNLISYYQLTDQIIEQLRIVCPEIFNELNNIKDKRGRSVDIEVKLIPKEDAKINLSAASFFKQSVIDEDAITSVYGNHSVAVDVWLTEQALFLLCHELGHLNYVIPNAAEYFKFYDQFYRGRLPNLSYIGHNRFDKSGKSAKVFEKKFRQARARYATIRNKRVDSAYLVMQRIRQNNKPLEVIVTTDAVLYNTSIK
ncbi:MAG: hypothetical protein WKF87_17790 [Chryseolinea sp.]